MSSAAPAAPEVAVSVDYSDVEGAYTPQARAKVSLEPSSADPDGDAVAYEWDAGSAPEGRYGLGTHEARVRAVDEWGAASEWAVCWIGYIFLDDFGRTKPAFLNSTGVMYPSVECILKLLYQCT